MLENQFIRFYPSVRTAKEQAVYPMVIETSDMDTEMELFIVPYNDSYSDISEIQILNEQGDVIASNGVQSSIGIANIVIWGQYLFDMDIPFIKNEIAVGDIFFIRTKWAAGQNYAYLYSQPIVRVDKSSTNDFSKIKYRCNDDALGFPFVTAEDTEHFGNYASAYIPIRLHSPQNVQDDKTYVKANGEVVTLYAKYYKEWEGETEYLSAEMHDKIVAALSCDEVYIDGKRVTKSDNYQVDWENYDLDCDGVTKLARATFKVRENTSQRNSNY